MIELTPVTENIFYQDLPGFIESLPELNQDDFHKSGRWLSLANIPASFDIETTSTYNARGEKIAFMYVWQLGINGSVLLGRTWDEFTEALEAVAQKLHLLQANRRLIIYVHNLAFEFQFMKHHFSWDNVFALKAHKVLYAICEPFEFRCSYLLSNYSLAYVGKNLQKYKIDKMEGDLDYSLTRHSATTLTPKEINYCTHDVFVVMAYITECIEEAGGIENIPLTNTGRVRNHCRELCLSSKRFRYLIRDLNITSIDEYIALKKTFMGGFVHCNAQHGCKNLHDVTGIDIASDYPARIVLDYFPMSSATYYHGVVDYDKILNLLSTKCCVFEVAFFNIRPQVPFENILSVSRVEFLQGQEDYIQNNGRLVSCDGWIRTHATELDLEWYSKFYIWDDIEIRNLYVYERGYLPTELVQAVLDFYEKKTTLKGVKEKVVEYMVSKNMINACYGMMVTDILRDDIDYEDGLWETIHNMDEGRIYRYNNNRKRFLFYPWGVYVTAHARSEIFSAIYEFANDYVYSDTDSIKAINYANHANWVVKYNSNIISKIIQASAHHKLPYTKFMPEDVSGRRHPIGIFENEGAMDTFRSCGAKRYIYWKDGNFNITVAGLGKYAGRQYLLDKYKTESEICKHFNETLFVPAGSTGKLTHTYIETEKAGMIKDYQGNYGFYDELSATHLEPASFSMSMLTSYLDYLHGVDELIYTE